MASGSALRVDIISDSSFSSSETDSDSDGNVRFSEFDSDSRQRSGSNDDAFLGFGEPADTPVFTWDKSYGPRPNPIPDFDDSNTGPTNSLNAEATTLDFFSLFCFCFCFCQLLHPSMCEAYCRCLYALRGI